MIKEKIKKYFEESFKRKQLRKQFKNSFREKFTIEPFYSSDFNEKSDLDLITISFNTPIIIDYQIRFFKKFLKGNYKHIICDNSTKEAAAREIKEICEREDITYIRVQDRRIPKGTADSHGIALNWTYRNVVKKRKNNFAFFDHDVYPLKEINVCDYLKDFPIYGKINKNVYKNIWYLWPGFCFYSWNYVCNLPLDFRRYRKFFRLIKVPLVDTGSANWNCIYSKINVETLKPFDFEIVDAKTNMPDKGIWADNVWFFENRSWIHIVDGADRTNESTAKINYTLQFLDAYLNEKPLDNLETGVLEESNNN